MSLAIGVDVGGSYVKAGIVAADGTVLETLSRPTPSASASAVVQAVGDTVEALRQTVWDEIVAVGIGAAGFVDAARSTVLFAPNLAWRHEPLRHAVCELVGVPVSVENDANAAAWGEHRFGAGAGVEDLVVVTIGTGIGGGVVLGGRLLRGAYGIAAEFGHLRVVPGGRRCGCGNRGCWEQYCSGRALAREARELVLLAPAGAGRLLELADGDVEGITGETVTAAAREGDPAALECFAQIGGWLGQGLADLAAILDPARFVVGGGVATTGDLLLGPARDAYAEALTGHAHRPHAEIVTARLGNDAGIVGAADLARTAVGDGALR